MCKEHILTVETQVYYIKSTNKHLYLNIKTRLWQLAAIKDTFLRGLYVNQSQSSVSFSQSFFLKMYSTLKAYTEEFRGKLLKGQMLLICEK